jgi:glycosyltransferase involved in cell wall biosynthesis
MWTHNSERNLHKVLKRIEEVIPEHTVNRKIITDDHSTDRTRKIADELDWEVHPNNG